MKATKEKKEELFIVINEAWCKGCGICIALCPKEALAEDQMGKAVWKDPAVCVRCGMCELRCPDLAITLETSKEKEHRE